MGRGRRLGGTGLTPNAILSSADPCLYALSVHLSSARVYREDRTMAYDVHDNASIQSRELLVQLLLSSEFLAPMLSLYSR